VDWTQVLYYFEQIYQALPNLRDGTNMTATERYRIAAINYGSQLADADKICQANEYFALAMSLGSDPQVQPTADWVAKECYDKQHPPTNTPKPDPTATPTVEGTIEEPTETLTETP
jgi:hypothetical protein